jgi:hypothetical protein
MDTQDKRGPLDGSTSGTIGGGGPESGGPSDRPRRSADDIPVKPENAASGRLEPDALDAAVEPDALRVGATDVSAAREDDSRDGD